MTTRTMGAVSACLVVRNEESVINRALLSLRGVVDEIVVVHDGTCDDRTLEIARMHGARIFVRPFAGFCEAHFDFAKDAAVGEWLLFVDADEFLSEPLRDALRLLVRSDEVDGYAFAWRTCYEDRGLRPRGGRQGGKLCLFRAEKTSFESRVHGRRTVGGAVVAVGLVLEHRPPYRLFDKDFWRAKVDRWAEVNARHLLATGAHHSALFHLLRSPLWFTLHLCENYFLNLAFLNGLDGFRYSLLMALFFMKTELNLSRLLREHKGQPSPTVQGGGE